MSGELKKILILSAGVLSFFLILMLTNSFPAIFTDLQKQVFYGTGFGIILVVVVLSMTKWWKR
jgi:hypothetical protein